MVVLLHGSVDITKNVNINSVLISNIGILYSYGGLTLYLYLVFCLVIVLHGFIPAFYLTTLMRIQWH